MTVRLLFVGLVSCVIGVGSLLSDPLHEIRMTGVVRIDEAFVRSRLPVKVGQEIAQEDLKKVVLSLFETDLFEDVQASLDGGVLRLVLKENRLLNRVAFEGNKKVDDDVLSKEVGLKSRQVYTLHKIRQAVQRIKDIYRAKGYAAAKVTPKTIERDQGRIDLVFEIVEGRPQRVERILFQGNTIFSDFTLRGVILTCETRWWRFFSSFDTYEPDRTAYDRELLYKHYVDHGYLDVQIPTVLAELSPDKTSFYITFKVSEGSLYTLDEIQVESKVKGLSDDDLKAPVNLKAGDVCRRVALEALQNDIARLVHKKGLFGRVEIQLKKDAATHTAKVRYTVVPEKPLMVRHVLTRGNTATNDEVIRRECQLVDGDPVSSFQLEQTRGRLYRLNFFKTVDTHFEELIADEKLRDLVVKVEDKSTGTLLFSGGYSTAMGLTFEARLAEGNFLGKGQEAELNLTLSQKVQSVTAGFTEPYLFDRRLEGGVTVFLQNVWKNVGDSSSTLLEPRKEGYSALNLGATLRTGYHITPDLYERLRYTIKWEKFAKKKVDSVFYKDAANDIASILGHDLIYDKRDRVVNPSRGGYVSLSTDWSGVGGSVYYLQNQLGGGYYYPLDRDAQFILRLRALYGVLFRIGPHIRTVDHFYMGGASVRGFEEMGVGPRDGSTANKESVGGRQKLVFNLEITAPLGPAELGLQGFVFNDWGSLWSSSAAEDPQEGHRVIGDDFFMRTTAGLGVRWQSPFGLLGFSLGWPLRKRKSVDHTQVFRFSFGTDF